MNRRQFLKNLGSSALLLVPGIQAFAQNAPLSDQFDGETESEESPLRPNGSGLWPVTRDWNRSEIERYGQWFNQIHHVKRTGTEQQRQAKLPAMLRDPKMNSLLNESDSDSLFNSEILNKMKAATACGTFPFLMHLYFSANRGLPAIYSKVSGGDDIRYSRNNHPVRHFDPLSFDGDLGDFIDAVFFSSRGGEHFTTGNWRTAPDLEGTDTIPIHVSPDTIFPGLTLGYNPNGHALAATKIHPDGNLEFLDGHPDGTITSAQSLAALEPVLGSPVRNNRASWYAGMRMIRLATVKKDGQGRIIGIRPRTNQEMRAFGFSDEQYRDILTIKDGKTLTINGTELEITDYPTYVQEKLKTSDIVNPYAVLADGNAQLRTMFEERARFVQKAWTDVGANGPITLPDTKNIYQAEGRWEEWSSPSSDVDRKNAYFLMVDKLERLVEGFETNKTNYELSGFPTPAPATSAELAQAIITAKDDLFAAPCISYTSSSTETNSLSLNAIEQRLFTMSFDPNHPPEIRWGAGLDSREARGYQRISTPLASGGSLSTEESYRREERLRYRLSRKDGRTSFDDPENPTAPLKTLLEERLSRFLK